jgi:hypothetical protein
MSESLRELIKSESIRLDENRKAILAQQSELEKKLAEIDLERTAIAAYEITMNGRLKQPKKPLPGRASRNRPASGRARPDSKRNTIIRVLMDNPTGLSMGEVVEKMGLTGDRRGEKSVANALFSLAKGMQVARQDGKYVSTTRHGE